VLRHFPVTDPSLAYTGSVLLSRAGEHRRSIYVAEILAKRLPDTMPAELLPPAYRQLLYPFGYSYLILREAARRDVDPYLLAAIVREESRFDPHAFSGASARGLTQFVFPTATRIAATAGLGPIAPRDLERPEVAIALGAAYLQELLTDLGTAHQAIAAYNAGEPQAGLWRRYCLSDEREEYLTKVAFRETRRYLEKVLTSRQHYTELYGPAAASATVGVE
jgi:soluble lytic murein transglycosylase